MKEIPKEIHQTTTDNFHAYLFINFFKNFIKLLYEQNVVKLQE